MEYTTLSEGYKMDWWVLVLIGVVVGAGGGTAITYKVVKPPEPPQQPPVVVVPDNNIKEEEIKLQRQLTKLDILNPLCAPEFIKDNKDGSLLCRELYCRIHAAAGEASQKECENISNQLNKSAVYRFCATSTSTIPAENRVQSLQECIELFDRRL